MDVQEMHDAIKVGSDGQTIIDESCDFFMPHFFSRFRSSSYLFLSNEGGFVLLESSLPWGAVVAATKSASGDQRLAEEKNREITSGAQAPTHLVGRETATWAPATRVQIWVGFWTHFRYVLNDS